MRERLIKILDEIDYKAAEIYSRYNNEERLNVLTPNKAESSYPSHMICSPSPCDATQSPSSYGYPTPVTCPDRLYL